MIAGSTINGFGLKVSDIDVMICQPTKKSDDLNKTNMRSAKRRYLTKHFLGFLGHYRGSVNFIFCCIFFNFIVENSYIFVHFIY